MIITVKEAEDEGKGTRQREPSDKGDNSEAGVEGGEAEGEARGRGHVKEVQISLFCGAQWKRHGWIFITACVRARGERANQNISSHKAQKMIQ